MQLDKEQLQAMAMNLSSSFAKTVMEAGNNAWANTIARRGAAEQAKQELEIAQQLEPSINLCSSVSYTLSLNGNNCEAETEIRDEAYEYLASSSLFNDDVSVKNKEIEDLAFTVYKRSPELFVTDPEILREIQAEEEESLTSVFDAYLLLTSAKPALNLTSDQQEAMKTMIKIVTPGYKYGGKTISEFDNSAKLELMQREFPMLAARQILLKVLSLRSMNEDESPSELMVYQELVDSFSDPSAVEAIANGNVTNPNALKRSQLIVSLYQAKIQLDQFKSSLRREYAQAHQLILLSK